MLKGTPLLYAYMKGRISCHMTFTLSSTCYSCTMQRTAQPQRWCHGAGHLLLSAAESEVAAPRAADAAAAAAAKQPAEQTASAAAAAAKWRC
jgi:hypothetical protein